MNNCNGCFLSLSLSFSGEHVTKQPLIAGMRTIKKETLKFLSCWVSKCHDTVMVRERERERERGGRRESGEEEKEK